MHLSNRPPDSVYPSTLPVTQYGVMRETRVKIAQAAAQLLNKQAANADLFICKLKLVLSA